MPPASPRGRPIAPQRVDPPGGRSSPSRGAGSSPPGPTPSPLADFLDRPRQQRALEYRYRFGQAVVFGLPVWALQFFGHSLGGPEAGRWVGILQALLAGWVVYVGAAGMLFEGVLRLMAGRLAADLAVAAAAVVLYLLSLWGVVLTLTSGGGAGGAAFYFHWCVLLLAVWAGFQWWRQKESRPA